MIDYSKFLPSATATPTKPTIDYSKFLPTSAKTENKPTTTQTKTISPYLGGGAYSSKLGSPNEIINTEPKSTEAISAVKGSERDHIVPYSLGGVNDKTNLRIEPSVKGNLTETDPLELKALNDYKSGKLSLPEARLQILTAKQIQEDKTKGIDQNPYSFTNLWEGLKQSFADIMPATKQSIEEIKTGVKSPPSIPKTGFDVVKGIAKNYAKAIYETDKDEIQRVKDLFSGGSISEKISKTIKAGVGGVNVALSPITATFSSANDIPILNTVAKIVTLPFATAGDVGKNATNQISNFIGLPQNIKEALGEVGSLAGQILAGGILDIKGKELLIRKYGAKDAKTITDLAQQKVDNTKIIQEPVKDSKIIASKTASDSLLNGVLDKVKKMAIGSKKATITNSADPTMKVRVNRDLGLDVNGERIKVKTITTDGKIEIQLDKTVKTPKKVEEVLRHEIETVVDRRVRLEKLAPVDIHNSTDRTLINEGVAKMKPITGYHITRTKEGLAKIQKEGFSLKNFGKESGDVGDPYGTYFFPNKNLPEDWADIASKSNTIKSELSIENSYKPKSEEQYFNEVVKPATNTKAKSLDKYRGMAGIKESKKITAYLQSQGYDSIVDKKGILSYEEPQIIVFDANKISQNKVLASKANQSKAVEEPLAQEATKYKSAEEFVKAQKGYVGKDTLTGKPINMAEEIAKKPKYKKIGDADFDAYSIEYYKRYEKEIKPQLLEHAKKAFDEPGKAKVIDVDMSGSYKRGTPNFESDLDVKVYYEGTKPVDEFRDQMETLSDNIYGIHDVHFQKVEAKSQLTDIWNKANKGIKETTVEPTKLEQKPSGVAKSIEAKAIEQGLISKGYDKLAGYNSSTLKEQAKIGSGYSVNEHIDFATGDKPLPEGLKPGTPLSIAEDYAMEKGDFELFNKLRMSPLASQISEAASGLSLSRIRTPDSATMRLKEAQKVLETKTRLKDTVGAKKEITSRIKRESNKVNLTKEELSWDKFLNEIKC